MSHAARGTALFLHRIGYKERVLPSSIDTDSYRDIFENAATAVAQVSLDGSFLLANPRYCELTGYTLAELRKMRFHDISHPDDLPEAVRGAREVLNGRASFSTDKRYVRKDGSMVWVNLNVSLVRDERGEPATFVAVLKNVDERKEAERQLADQAAQLSTILETVPVGVVMAELPSGKIVGGNSYVETLLRHPVIYSSDIHSYDEWVSFHADGTRVAGHEYPLARMIIAQEEAPSIDVNYQRGDGTLCWLRISGRPVRNATGEIIGGVVSLLDIDEERRALERISAELQTLQDQLIHATRLSAVEAMAATLAHELNQPIGAAANYLGAAKRLMDAPDASKASLAVEQALGAVMQAGDTVRSVRELVSGGVGAAASVQISDVLRDVMLVLGPTFKPRPVIAVEAGADVFYAQRVQVEQVLLNLLRNAADAVAAIDRPKIRLSVSRREDYVEFRIEDNGARVPPEIRQQQFAAFKSTKGGGLGLGLSVSKRIVERHGGRLWVEEGKGTKAFCFSVPICPVAAGRPQ